MGAKRPTYLRTSRGILVAEPERAQLSGEHRRDITGFDTSEGVERGDDGARQRLRTSGVDPTFGGHCRDELCDVTQAGRVFAGSPLVTEQRPNVGRKLREELAPRGGREAVGERSQHGTYRRVRIRRAGIAGCRRASGSVPPTAGTRRRLPIDGCTPVRDPREGVSPPDAHRSPAAPRARSSDDHGRR